MRAFLSLLILTGLILSEAEADDYHAGFDRRGSIYDRIELDGATSAACAALCAADPQCQSWTLSLPGLESAYAQCALLLSAPTPQRRPGYKTGLSPNLRDRIDAASERPLSPREIEALAATRSRPYR